MKTVYIIAVAVGCSVIAVFGVSFAWQEILVWQFEQELEKIEQERIRAEKLEEEKERLYQKKIQDEITALNLEKAESRARYKKIPVTEWNVEYANCRNKKLTNYCNVVLNEMTSIYCETIPLDTISGDSPSYQKQICTLNTSSEIKQNKTLTYTSFLIEEKSRYFKIVDSCRFDRGLSPYLEDPETTKCVCDYGVIGYPEWYELCS